MKKIILMLIVVMTSFIFTISCGSGSGSDGDKIDDGDKKIKIGLSMAELAAERWRKERDYFVGLANELGAEVLVQAANRDEALQVSQAENLLSQGIDVLVIIPYNGESIAVIVDRANEMGIPVIAYDRLILNSDVDLYISFDNVRVGEVLAEEIVKIMPKGNYVYLGGATTDNNAFLLKEGSMNILGPLQEKGDISIVFDQFTEGWKPEIAQRHMENALTKNNNDVQAVVTAYDGLAHGAIQALTEQGLEGKVPVSGQDAELAAVKRVVEGTQTITVYKSLKLLATTAAEAAVALARDENISPKNTVNNKKIDVPSILLEPIIINKDNIQLLIDDNFFTAEEIYGDIPKDKWPEGLEL